MYNCSPINTTTTFMIEEVKRENVVLNATYVAKTAAGNCTVGCGGDVMPTTPVALSGESTRGVKELHMLNLCNFLRSIHQVHI